MGGRGGLDCFFFGEGMVQGQEEEVEVEEEEELGGGSSGIEGCSTPHPTFVIHPRRNCSRSKQTKSVKSSSCSISDCGVQRRLKTMKSQPKSGFNCVRNHPFTVF